MRRGGFLARIGAALAAASLPLPRLLPDAPLGPLVAGEEALIGKLPYMLAYSESVAKELLALRTLNLAYSPRIEQTALEILASPYQPYGDTPG